MQSIIFAALALLSGGAAAAAGLDVFVSPTGSDGGAGTKGSPYASPARALQAVAAAKAAGGGACPAGGIVVHLGAGTYFLSAPLLITPTNTCDAINPLLIVGDDAAGRATISAGTTLAFAPLAGYPGVFSAPVPAALPGSASFVRAIFANGTDRRYLQRSPIATAVAVGQWGVEYVPGTVPSADPAVYAEAEVVIWHQWTNSQNKIARIFFDNATILPVGTAGDPFLSAGGKRWALQNVADTAALAAGEYYVAGGRIVYRALPGEDPASTPFVAERFPEAIQVVGTAGAVVAGLALANVTVAHAAAGLEEQCLSQGCGGQSNSGATSAAVHATYAAGLTLDGVELAGVGGYALWFDEGCIGCVLRQSWLHDLGQGGVRVGNGQDTGAPSTAPSRDCVVADTVIADAGHVVPAGTGVLAQECANTTITHNHVHHLRYTAVSTGWSWGYMATSDAGNTVSFNSIHDVFMGELTDGGCIYNLGRSPGTLIDNNLCHTSEAYNYGGWGLYTDEGSSNVTLRNNVVFNTKDAAFHQHYGTDNLITNNIWAFGSGLYCNVSSDDCDRSALRSSQHPVSNHDAGVNSSFTFTGNIVLLGAANVSASPWVRNVTSIVRTSGPTLGVANFTYAGNLYWHNALPDPASQLVFGASGDPLTFAQWQAAGKDAAGAIADPLFADVGTFNFSLLPGSPALAMGFQPIDVSTVGVRSGPYRGL